eukprot:6420720-Prymnesium_polylepis.1
MTARCGAIAARCRCATPQVGRRSHGILAPNMAGGPPFRQRPQLTPPRAQGVQGALCALHQAQQAAGPRLNRLKSVSISLNQPISVQLHAVHFCTLHQAQLSSRHPPFAEPNLLRGRSSSCLLCPLSLAPTLCPLSLAPALLCPLSLGAWLSLWSAFRSSACCRRSGGPLCLRLVWPTALPSDGGSVAPCSTAGRRARRSRPRWSSISCAAQAWSRRSRSCSRRTRHASRMRTSTAGACRPRRSTRSPPPISRTARAVLHQSAARGSVARVAPRRGTQLDTLPFTHLHALPSRAGTRRCWGPR